MTGWSFLLVVADDIITNGVVKIIRQCSGIGILQLGHRFCILVHAGVLFRHTESDRITLGLWGGLLLWNLWNLVSGRCFLGFVVVVFRIVLVRNVFTQLSGEKLLDVALLVGFCQEDIARLGQSVCKIYRDGCFCYSAFVVKNGDQYAVFVQNIRRCFFQWGGAFASVFSRGW